ncbi:MAG TPA: VTT domain-containing protein [Burkholderiales bacterium]
MNARAWLRALLVLTVLVAVGLALEAVFQRLGIDRAWIDAHIRGRGFYGELVFVVVGAVAIALGMPRQSLCFLAGYAFGFAGGAALGLLATSIGSIAAFYCARLLGRAYVQSHLTGRWRDLDAYMSAQPFLAALWLRLLPVGNNLLTNVGAGVASVRPVPFFAGSALGYVPQTLVFALAGSGIAIHPAERLALSLALFAATVLFTAWLYRRLPPGTAQSRA